jgi:hypothetical protein
MDNQDFAGLQSQFQEMQNILHQQAKIIAGLTAAARDQQHHQNHHHTPHNSLGAEVLKQFIKSPTKFYGKVNPRSPCLCFDGSNYTKWETAIDRALQHAFVRNTSFLNDNHNNFLLLDSLQNKAVAMLMRSTLEDALLSIVESHGISLLKELYALLQSKCK